MENSWIVMNFLGLGSWRSSSGRESGKGRSLKIGWNNSGKWYILLRIMRNCLSWRSGSDKSLKSSLEEVESWLGLPVSIRNYKLG